MDNPQLAELTRAMADRGRLVEAGWLAFMAMAVPTGAPEEVLSDLRLAFKTGAHHLFFSMKLILGGPQPATEDDLRRMDNIDAELEVFRQELVDHVKNTIGMA